MLVTELTLHLDALREGLRLRSMALLLLQTLHLPRLDVDGGVLHLLQTSGGVLDLEYITLAYLFREAKSHVTDKIHYRAFTFQIIKYKDLFLQPDAAMPQSIRELFIIVTASGI